MGEDEVPTSTKATPPGNATPTKITKKKGKKRKISKHILDSKMKTMNPSSNDDGDNNPDSTIPPKIVPNIIKNSNNKKQKTTKEKKHIKDPVDVEGYLLAWKQQQESKNANVDDNSDENDKDCNPSETAKTTGTTGLWKFNKNTQSWLIRHLYDSNKISKHVFAIAIEYFLKSNITVQQRLQQDAIQRIIQYQEEAKNKESDTTKKKNIEVGKDDDHNNTNEDENGMTAEEKNQRKEYKRARKIVETFTAKQQQQQPIIK